jgi:hypothetical protein
MGGARVRPQRVQGAGGYEHPVHPEALQHEEKARAPQLDHVLAYRLSGVRPFWPAALLAVPLTLASRAESVVDAWNNLTAQSTAIYNSLPSSMKPAFFQLVHHEVLASATLGKMWIAAGQNNMRAEQARLSTNDMADTVEDLFGQDYDLEHQYHTILDGARVLFYLCDSVLNGDLYQANGTSTLGLRSRSRGY